MKSILANDYVNWTLRTIVGFVLIVAAIDKAADPASFAASIANYRILPDWASMTVATTLPWIELLAGLCILFGVLRTGGALLASALFATFTVLVLSALVRGLDIACGCFTQDPQVGMITWVKVLENLGLLIASFLIYRSDNFTFSIEEYLARSAREVETAGPA
jgi:uncharacterized membrane protein YphA (DoxX/SURF4 family)